jgi:hypothetical protein
VTHTRNPSSAQFRKGEKDHGRGARGTLDLNTAPYSEPPSPVSALTPAARTARTERSCCLKIT